MGELIVDKKFLLKKFPGKGGWTFAEIPNVLPDKKSPFGWVKVSGSLDNYLLEHYKLMPMGKGKLFLPIKAAIRKIIGKQAGDYVKIKLYEHNAPLIIPDELIACFNNEPPETFENFRNFTEGEQKVYLDWIYSAKKEETKVQRIVKMMDRVMLRKKFYDFD
jgi:uncharacterized protein DUF1905/bacteriocin resistance YdeI/OmpD-like protein